MMLVPEAVVAGDWWRVFTFLFVPPATNPIFAFFGWYLFYLMGSTLEAQWGAFRYNIYLAARLRGVAGDGLRGVFAAGEMGPGLGDQWPPTCFSTAPSFWPLRGSTPISCSRSCSSCR